MVDRDIAISQHLRLVAPEVGRDAETSVLWRSGTSGRETQLSMGIPPSEVVEPTLEDERKLIRSLIETKDEIVWMIQFDQTTIGAVEVGLNQAPSENGPSVSIMIGELSYRGKGLGKQVLQAVLNYLISVKNYRTVHARYLVSNVTSEHLNRSVGFRNDGDPYIDADGLKWQNVVYD